MTPRDDSGYHPWRRYPHDLDGAWHAIHDLRQEIDRMDRADEIAQKVTEQMKRDTALGLNLLQKALLAGVACVSMAGSVAALVQVLTH